MSYDDGSDAVGASASPELMSSAAALHAVCWGTRGSIPSPGPATARFGGNTPCLEVRTGGQRLIFDAGTGIHVLGRELARQSSPLSAHLFLTHFHWDHIQGIPFFAPLYDASTELHIHGAPQAGVDIQTLFAGQMGPIYFPVPVEAVAARLRFSHLDDEPWTAEGVEVDAIRVRHPGDTYGYRVRAGDAALAFLPDNELVGGPFRPAAEFRRELRGFLSGVDLLFHDAMYTDDEYAARAGWGHSTFAQAVEMAAEAGVRRLFLFLFHHAPERSDLDLMQIVDQLRNDLARRGADLQVEAAAEGEELLVQEPAP